MADETSKPKMTNGMNVRIPSLPSEYAKLLIAHSSLMTPFEVLHPHYEPQALN